MFGVALVVAVFARVGGYGGPQQVSAGFAATLGVCALLSVAGAALALRLKSRAQGSTVDNVEGAQP